MHRHIRRLMIAGLFCFLAPTLAAASDPQPPSYLILQPPAQRDSRHGSTRYFPARGFSVSANNYAYGWFGAHPRRHKTRHHGYLGHYTQWTWK